MTVLAAGSIVCGMDRPQTTATESKEGETMLRVTGNVGAMVAAAVANGSIASLVSRLEYLNTWGCEEGRTNCETRVEAYVDRRDPGEGADLRFLRSDEGETMMVGGLVYHSASNDYGMHT